MRALAWADFAGAEGATYRVDGDGQPEVELTLARVVELPSAGRAEGSFRLDFRGPIEPALPQAIYRFRSGEECYEIFIVPVGRDENGTHYEAVFN